jgi:hypothetical protein
MDRTLQTLRALALITLLISVLTILSELPVANSAQFPQVDVTLNGPLNGLARVTSSMLGFATGIVALVVAAQRHHRGWFVWILVPSLATPYGSFLPFSTVIFQAQDFRDFLILIVLGYTIPPIVTSLAVLAYTLRLWHPSTAPAVAGETDLEIEYTRLT